MALLPCQSRHVGFADVFEQRALASHETKIQRFYLQNTWTRFMKLQEIHESEITIEDSARLTTEPRAEEWVAFGKSGIYSRLPPGAKYVTASTSRKCSPIIIVPAQPCPDMPARQLCWPVYFRPLSSSAASLGRPAVTGVAGVTPFLSTATRTTTRNYWSQLTLACEKGIV